MAYVFSCPQCAATLKTGAPVLEGRSVQCPHCGHVFFASDTTVREEQAAAFPSPPPVPPSPLESHHAASSRDEEQMPPRRREESNRDSRRDEDGEPRRRRRENDEGDRDRPRRSARDDDEPRRRRRRDEDEGFDRPRRRPRGNNRVALIVVLGVLAAMVTMVILIWRLVEDEQDVPYQPFASGVDTEMITLAPADSVILVGMNVNDLRKNGKFARIIGSTFMNRMPDRQRFERKLEEAGLTENDVSGVLIATSAPGGSGPVIVVRFNKDIERDRFIKAFDAVRHSDEMKKYYTSGVERSNFFFAGKRLLVVADNRNTLKKLLHHDRTQVQLPPDLRDLAAKGTGQYWLVMKKDGGQDAMKGVGMGFGAEEIFAGFADQTDSVTVSIVAVDDQLDCELGLKLKGDKNAADVAGQMRAELDALRRFGVKNNPNFRNLPPDEQAVAQAIQQTATFRTDGPIAHMKYRITIGMFERLLQANQFGRPNQPRIGP